MMTTINSTILSGFFCGPKKGRYIVKARASNLSTFTTDSAGKLDVLWHDGDTLGVNGTQVGIFEKTNQVSLASLLESHNSRALESKISLEVLGNFTNQTLEGQFSDQQFSALLVTTDLSQCYGSWPVSVWLLHASCCWGTLTSSLGSKLLSWSLSSSGFTSGLLCTSHVCILREVNSE